jgi:alpha/beta superfamily hydrolase
MSEYVRKQALLDRLDELIGYFGGNSFLARALKRTMEEIQSGAFDAPDGEVQRLRAALDWVKRQFEEEWTYELGTGEVVEEIIVKFEEALSGAQEKEEPNHDT